MIVETVDQKKALRPKAAKGNAVAVPRWSGKFEAAVFHFSYVSYRVKAGTKYLSLWLLKMQSNLQNR